MRGTVTRLSRHATRALLGVVMAATAIAVAPAVGPTPVGAELSNEPTTTWGVTGTLTGSQTDTINAEVFASEQIGNVLYLGGRFTAATNGVTTEPQVALAAFDATTGDFISSWRPTLTGGAVYALEASPDGSRLFVGGDFETVNGSATGGLVALVPSTGEIDTMWAGRVGGYNLVRGLDVGQGYVYAAGGFTSISSGNQGSVAYRTGRFDLDTGMIDDTWLPVIQGGSIWGIAASPTEDRVYLAGYLNSSNFVFAQNGFAAVSSIDGSNVPGLDAVIPNTANLNRRYLYDVEVAGGYVWIAGSEHFVQVLNESDLSLHKFHMSQPNNGDFQDLEVVGDRVYAGCHCRLGQFMETSDTTIYWQNAGIDGVKINTGPIAWVTAFDANTGLRETTFNPTFSSSGPGIWAIHGSPDGCVWFAGDVTSAGGQVQYGVVRYCEEGANPVDDERPTVPGKPQVANLGPDSVDLSWNPSTDNFGVVGYRVYAETIDGVASGAVLLDSPTNSGTLTGLAPGVYQTYTRAYDLAGNESYRSGFTTFTITGVINSDTERPSTPGRPQVVSLDADSASLVWFESTDNVGVTNYRIVAQSIDGVPSGAVLLDAPTNAGIASGLAAGTYQVFTRAYDAAGNESYRSGFTTFTITGTPVDTERPTPPAGLLVSGIAGDSVDLTWTASTDNVGVAGYRIYDQANNVVATVTAPSGSVSGLAPGSYGLYVKAFDAAGNESWRSNIATFDII